MLDESESLYTKLGLPQYINAWGTITDIGGSTMSPEVTRAMAHAATGYVDVGLLMQRGGEYLAERIGVDAVCVTAGAAAGLVLGAQVLLDERRDGGQLQVLAVAGHVTEYLRAAVPPAVPVAEVQPSDLQQALAGRPAFLFLDVGLAVQRGIDIAALIATADQREVPTLVDAAAELPPKENLTAFHRAGATIVVFSGGKQIRGPQSSGLVIASKPIIERCLAQSTPNHGVARSMKVDKETIVGIVRAVELYLDEDEAEEAERHDMIADAFLVELATADGLHVRRGLGKDGVRPSVIPRVFIRPVTGTAEDLRRALRAHRRPVLVGMDGDEIFLNPQCLQVRDVEPVVAALRAAGTRMAQ